MYWKRALYFAVFVILAGCGDSGTVQKPETVSPPASNAGSSDITATPVPYPETPPISEEDKAAYLNAVNSARGVEQDCGKKGIHPAAPALRWNDALYGAAFEHSADMAQSDTFSHEGSGTEHDWTGYDLGRPSSVTERAENNGYHNWKYLGENIAAGTEWDTPREAVDAWLKSDDHCANLMNPDFTELGMAVVKNPDSTYVYYWTQEMGSR